MVDAQVLADVPLFASLDEPARRKVAAWFELRSVTAGTQLTGEGASGYSFFVLSEGSAQVTVGGETIAQLGPGDRLPLSVDDDVADVVRSQPRQRGVRGDSQIDDGGTVPSEQADVPIRRTEHRGGHDRRRRGTRRLPREMHFGVFLSLVDAH